MARSSVLLPLPLGPSSTKNSPSPMSSETSLTTGDAAVVLGDLVEGDGHSGDATGVASRRQCPPGHGPVTNRLQPAER